jgi:hypothetical protein
MANLPNKKKICSLAGSVDNNFAFFLFSLNVLKLFMRKILIAFIILVSINTNAQNNNNQKLKVFLDCTQSWLCDFDYVRTEITVVDFVRDRFLADVHVIVNTNFTSAGGSQQVLSFLGLKNFSGLNDSLTLFNEPTATDQIRRASLVKYLKLGLTRYVARTGLAENIDISYKGLTNDTTSTTGNQVKKDPWRYWIFALGASGFFDGDQNYSSNNINSFVNADKETEELRMNFSLRYGLNRNRFQISPTDKLTVNLYRYNGSFSIAKKWGEHWAGGLESEYRKDVFSNIDNRLSVRPRVEYSFTPYKKFNTDRVIAQYIIGPEWSDYDTTTIYLQTSEFRIRQDLNLISSFTKPWGTINVGAFWSNYVHNFNLYNFSISGSVNWNIFKGFQFGVGGQYSLVRDQIFLPNTTATRDDLLTRRRALATGYSYFFGVGFSYRFGSIFNNQVHPTFRGLNWGLNF